MNLDGKKVGTGGEKVKGGKIEGSLKNGQLHPLLE